MTVALQHTIDFHALLESPGNLVEGSIWSAWWALGAYFSGSSLYELYQAFTVEHPANEKFTKIGLAVKTAFVDLLSLGTSTCYVTRFAHEAKVILLGQYLPFVKNLCLGLSAVMYGTEFCWDIYQISVEVDAIHKEESWVKRESHRQRLSLHLLKGVSNVTMVAWAVLSIPMLGVPALLGLAVSSALTTMLLTVGTVLGVAAFFYKSHLDEQNKENSPPVFGAHPEAYHA